jgi:hypothetical protein
MKTWIFFLSFMAFVGVSKAQEGDFEQWKIKRTAELTGEDGWLNLAGLFWMDARSPFLEEVNSTTLGFAEEAGYTTLGKFEFGQDSVWFVGMNLFMQEKNIIPPSNRTLVFPMEYGSGGVYFKNWKWPFTQ